jgi:hypothetical protein
MPEATARPSRWRVFAPDSAGAIYGTIAAMAVIAGAATDPAHGKALGLTIATLSVFWLAHVYAQTLAHHLRGAVRPDWAAVRAAMAEERSLLEGPVPMLALLALGELGMQDEQRGRPAGPLAGRDRAGHLGHPVCPRPALGLAAGADRRRHQRAVRAGHRVLEVFVH